MFWLLTWLLAQAWQPPAPARQADLPEPAHWTPRDQAALQIVRRYQDQVDELTPAQLTDPQFYLQQSRRLALDLASHYHPHAKDPISSLTVPEVLAAARLAIDDMEAWMLESVPGSQLLTIGQWKWLQHAPKWVRRAQNAAWAAGILLNPANVLKYVASQATVGPVTEQLQAEFLATLYLRFIRQLGFYLVEMNSGRLRGGADHYRQVFAALPRDMESIAGARLAPESLVVALIGQVKAGKSSVVNALIGKRVARTDVLPETKRVSRFRLDVPDSALRLTLLDTPGYADSGATKREIEETRQALREADVVLLVLDAHAPARSADRVLIDELRKWYAAHPELKPAPILICLTHIDLLSPVMEWDPPYDWRNPRGHKEQSIHEAVEHVRGLFADVARDVVAICTEPSRGAAVSVLDELLPSLLPLLSDGQMAALLRTYHEELRRGQLQSLIRQIQSSGKQLLKMWLDERLAPSSQAEAAAPASKGIGPSAS